MKLANLREDLAKAHDKTATREWLDRQWKVREGAEWKDIGTKACPTLYTRTHVNTEIVLADGEVDMYVWNGHGRTTPVNELEAAEWYVRDNPPFKFGTISGVVLILKGSCDDVSKFPTTSISGGVTIDSESFKSLKGISRACKSLGMLRISSCDPDLSGMLELAMITYTNKKVGWLQTANTVPDSVRTAAAYIVANLRNEGPGNKILELRKKLIDAGLEKHL